MTYTREPVLQPVPIESLRPTQITVGMREVEEKRKRLRKQKPRKIGSFIGRHMIPVVLGPKKRYCLAPVTLVGQLTYADYRQSIVASGECLDRDCGQARSPRAVNSGKPPFPFSNCKIILQREFGKGFGIHRDLSPELSDRMFLHVFGYSDIPMNESAVKSLG